MDYSFIRLRITPSILDERLLQTLVTHSLRSLYGEVNPHRVDVLGCLPCNYNEARSSEAILRTRTDSVGCVAAAMTMTSIPPQILGSDPMCIEIVVVDTDLVHLGGSVTKISTRSNPDYVDGGTIISHQKR